MDLLSLLTNGATAGVNAMNAQATGRQQKRDREQADLLARIEADAKRERDTLDADYKRSQIANIESQVQERSRPTPRNIDPLSPEGRAATLELERERAKFRPETPRNIDPLSPEGIRAAAQRAAALANAQPQQAQQGVQLTPTQIEKMNTLDEVISLARNTSMSMGRATVGPDGKPVNVTGRMGGVIPLPAWVRNAAGVGGEQGMSARNLLGNLVSTVGQMRSGGAISPQEFDRLEAFLPTENDDESVVMVKLRNFVNTLEDIRRIRLENYQRYGRGGTGMVQPERGTADDPYADLIVPPGGQP